MAQNESQRLGGQRHRREENRGRRVRHTGLVIEYSGELETDEVALWLFLIQYSELAVIPIRFCRVILKLYKNQVIGLTFFIYYLKFSKITFFLHFLKIVSTIGV